MTTHHTTTADPCYCNACIVGTRIPTACACHLNEMFGPGAHVHTPTEAPARKCQERDYWGAPCVTPFPHTDFHHAAGGWDWEDPRRREARLLANVQRKLKIS